MDFKLLAIAILFITSCSSTCKIGTYDEGSNEKLFEVKLTSKVHHPYCGGAYPTPGQEMGYSTITDIKAYYVSKDSLIGDLNNSWKIERDEDTCFTFRIPAGTYFVHHTDKAKSLEEYMSIYGSSNSTHIMGDAKCYERWMNTPDYKFTVTKNEDFELTYRSRCFTGTNPCMSYDGPYPP